MPQMFWYVYEMCYAENYSVRLKVNKPFEKWFSPCCGGYAKHLELGWWMFFIAWVFVFANKMDINLKCGHNKLNERNSWLKYFSQFENKNWIKFVWFWSLLSINILFDKMDIIYTMLLCFGMELHTDTNALYHT